MYYSVQLFDKYIYIILYPEVGLLIVLQQYFDVIINCYNCSGSSCHLYKCLLHFFIMLDQKHSVAMNYMGLFCAVCMLSLGSLPVNKRDKKPTLERRLGQNFSSWSESDLRGITELWDRGEVGTGMLLKMALSALSRPWAPEGFVNPCPKGGWGLHNSSHPHITCADGRYRWALPAVSRGRAIPHGEGLARA